MIIIENPEKNNLKTQKQIIRGFYSRETTFVVNFFSFAGKFSKNSKFLF